MTPSLSEPLVRLVNIHKRFGAVHANDNISLDIRAGRIKALLGENGAGKSTLMNILAGRYHPDDGHIWIQGRQTTFSSTQAAIDAGIGMVYQHFMLVDAMTVTENIFLGRKELLWLKPGAMTEQVRELGTRYGLSVDPAARVSDLSMGEKQRVEILKLLFRKSSILIFDEPTSVLTPQETEQLFDALRIMALQGKAIVFITHKLKEVMALADEITILRGGRVVDDLEIDQVSSRADLARRMVGREVLLEIERESVDSRQLVLRIDRLQGTRLKEICFNLRQGEILGLVGVAGNGQKELVETICGLAAPAGGTVSILGMSWERFFKRPRWDGTLSYIPEDRQGLATCPNLAVLDNFLLTTRQGFCWGPWLQKHHAGEKARDLVHSFGIDPPDIRIRARHLSGGNLQKWVLAREFYRRPRLIIAEQPTQGLDIAAIQEIWGLLLKARTRAGILLITGDLSEALVLADRIAVMFDGQIMDIFDADDQTKIEQIGPMMAGIKPDANLPPPSGGKPPATA